ncbi:hypothetical protein LCGC14_0141210 [marine sediment metagenome]|uniref:Uncharacterized protein n=1 Tax=marine sediment metagenome TaxID=412755 RepID=A0A0F9V0Y4_9ZZZZ
MTCPIKFKYEYENQFYPRQLGKWKNYIDDIARSCGIPESILNAEPDYARKERAKERVMLTYPKVTYVKTIYRPPVCIEFKSGDEFNFTDKDAALLADIARVVNFQRVCEFVAEPIYAVWDVNVYWKSCDEFCINSRLRSNGAIVDTTLSAEQALHLSDELNKVLNAQRAKLGDIIRIKRNNFDPSWMQKNEYEVIGNSNCFADDEITVKTRRGSYYVESGDYDIIRRANGLVTTGKEKTVCQDCKGTGRITMLIRDVDCDCVKNTVT